MLTLNLRFAGADPDAVVALVRATGADVLALEEVPRPGLDRLDAAGLSATLPHCVVGLGGDRVRGWQHDMRALPAARAGVRRVATHELPRTDPGAFFAELVLPAE